MISITKDRKSATFIITKTDNEGYHRQMNVTEEEMEELKELIQPTPSPSQKEGEVKKQPTPNPSQKEGR